jgi:autotransporter-associated beta strand protein
VNDGNAVMNPNVGPNQVKRFQRYEIAMLMDAGWNVYNWDNGNGNWKDGVNANGSFTLSASNWRTDSGIVYDPNTGAEYNMYGHSQQAPVLAPYGQVTSNIVLNFGGSGAAAYTSINNLGDIRVSRLNLNSTSTATNTINNASTTPNATLIFGVNLDGSSSVLTPKIVQQNSGAFNVNTNLLIANTTGAVGGGWTGLTVDGVGSGQVSLGGVVSGSGGLTKAGAFTLQLSGPNANTYSGLTTVQAGTLLLNKTPGQDATAGSLTINSGGTVRLGAADQLPGTGTVTLAGGTLSTGAAAGFSDVAGAFEVTSASTITLGTGAHTLQFSGFHDSSLAGTLTITGWNGDPHVGGGTAGRILISGVSGDPNSLYSGWLSTVRYQGFSQGGIFITTTTSGTYELTPIPTPEPAAVLGLAFAGLGLGALIRRRRKLSAEHIAIAP